MIELVEKKASIQPVKSKLKISILEDEEIREINQAAFGILEDVGISFPSERVLRIFAEAGADADFDRKIVRMPAEMVTANLAQAPGRFT